MCLDIPNLPCAPLLQVLLELLGKLQNVRLSPKMMTPALVRDVPKLRAASTSPLPQKTHVLCVKSILAGSNRPNSLIHGNGIVAIHRPSMAATSTRVHNGSRNM